VYDKVEFLNGIKNVTSRTASQTALLKVCFPRCFRDPIKFYQSDVQIDKNFLNFLIFVVRRSFFFKIIFFFFFFFFFTREVESLNPCMKKGSYFLFLVKIKKKKKPFLLFILNRTSYSEIT
jgi:hypothetical protein